MDSSDRLLATSIKSYGLNDYKTAEVRGFRAMALQKLGRAGEARQEFEAAIAILIEPDKSIGNAEASAFRAQRLQGILNAYLHLLVGPDAPRTPKDIAEAFRIADVVRWQSVQKAVSGSALRSAAGTPELGAKIKTLQNNEDELQAVYKNLIAQRSAPPDKQLPSVIAAMEKRIEAIQKEQAQALVDIRRQFPKYDALVNPRPADLVTARQALLPGEALLSIYVTDAGTYVWAAASGPDAALQFHFSPKPKAWLTEQVKRLRDAVDLTTGVSPDRMKFDVEAAHAIYQEFLAPVESTWAKGDTLLVVANDALGQVPFSMLVTNEAPAKAEPGLPLSHYRQTPWLLRKAAISYLPSISTLVTLRSVASSKAQRSPFIGFGDPDFGKHASAASAVSRGTRNLKVSQAPKFDELKLGIDSADSISTAAQVAAAAVVEVPELAALPDTRDEITAIATALSADLSKDTFFGAQATPQNVISANLKSRRIVAFATHGLVAGDLPGLDQPALALSPAPGKDIYSGLLKLEEVLKLSMDADLVVLSACNTAASDGSGSEAVSGLVRGFFYAGSRSVLATHWPVETVSARQLVTHLFERYSKVEGLSRAKSLQRAMLEVLDKEVAKDGRGSAVNAYAHPAYWAPYALYGDPGR
jgi:CHAT domain-containing protein